MTVAIEYCDYQYSHLHFPLSASNERDTGVTDMLSNCTIISKRAALSGT